MSDLINDPNSTANKLLELDRRLAALEQRQVEVGSLDEFSDDLGDIRAGMFIAGEGSPGGGDLSGTAMMYPPLEMTIGANTYQFSIVGCNNGVLQFGISAVNGQAIFAGGDASIGENGININKMGYLIQHSATDGVTERIGKMGMWPEEGSTVPCYGIWYSASGDTELIVNGGAESGDLTGWTDNSTLWSVETAAFSWLGNTCPPHGGNNMFFLNLSGGGVLTTETLTSDQIAVSANTKHVLSFWAARVDLTVNSTNTVAVKWYDASDVLLRTDTYSFPTFNVDMAWRNVVQDLVSPATASYVVIVITSTGIWTNRILLDDLSLIAISVSGRLFFDSQGVLKLNGHDLIPDGGLFGFNQMRGYLADGTEVNAGASVNLLTSTNTKSGVIKQWGTPMNQNGSYWIGHILLAKGTYTFALAYNKAASLGKIDLYMDGVKQNVTSVDMYSATAVYDSQWDLTGIAIVSDGIHEIKFVANGKNASSSAYGMSGNVFGFYRTD